MPDYLDDILDDILCGSEQSSIIPNENDDDIECHQIKGNSVQTTSFLAVPDTLAAIKRRKPGKALPMTVMGIGGAPVVVEDPARFRKDIQHMVMSQMSAGYISDKEFEIIKSKASMIEIATINTMRRAAAGDLKAYEVMMDRVLGRSVNQTKNVNLNVSYEDLIAALDPNEEIVPDDIIDVDIIGKI